MAPEKRCLYEILALSRDRSPEEIRSAYKKLALQRHPDKLIQTGVPEEEATAAFQELVNAYEVLSDPRERAWYDSHRSQILFSDATNVSKSSSGFSTIPNIFSFFSNSVYSGYGDTGKGFFKVYGDVFDKIYAQEVMFAKKLGLGSGTVRDAPLMGNLESPYAQVSAFYNYWLGFCTVMDFCWVDEYDAMAGPNRKSRRLMEEENKKLRKRAKKEYNEMVRGLAEFVKKRDKRVIDMQMKRNMEQEKRREEERTRKKEAERAKLEKARLYEEPEWAKVDEEEMENDFDEPDDDKKQSDARELYCVVCSKKFKSDKQWKNHEQSKKHREKVAQLRDTFEMEDDQEESGNEEGLGSENIVEELREEFEDALDFQEAQREAVSISSDDEGIEVSFVNDSNGFDESFGSDEEASILEAMVSEHKNRTNNASKRQPKSYARNDSEETDFMEYDNRKISRRNRAAKKEGSRKTNGEVQRTEIVETAEEVESKYNGNNVPSEDHDRNDSSTKDALSHALGDTDANGRVDRPLDKGLKVLNQPIDKKGTGKKDVKTKSKNSSKGKKEKVVSKASGNSCETCGENFETRNKLHKHLESSH
uniref:DNAJ protein JJJ1 homolog n=1 Tax=Nelumbo nucifera TaxID=4432 RepID=A0A822Z0N7_NELNU|nr:TPA_asm: hypothetical protein HUJ06_005678 [Nelumbo nucifera]